MLYGDYRHLIDEKNRLSLPAAYRSTFSGSFILTKGFENSLAIYTVDTWESIQRQTLLSVGNDAERNRVFERMLYSGVIEASLDKQGRIILPQQFIDYAGLKKNIATIGVNNRIEIWDEEKWVEYSSKYTLSEVSNNGFKP